MTNKNDLIVVCKAGGFIGGHLVADLRRQGFTRIKLKRSYKLNAPKWVNGRNSDNTLIQQVFGWEPDTKLRVGMEKTYRWIYNEMVARQRGEVRQSYH